MLAHMECKGVALESSAIMDFMSTTSDQKEEAELLLTYLNVTDLVTIMENLYRDGEVCAGGKNTVTQAQEAYNNEERTDSLFLSGQETSLLSSVKYGTTKELLSFANQVSDATKHLHQCLQQECGIILNKMLTIRNGRYQTDTDVLLFPWKMTYKSIGSEFIPRGAFGKVHLAQDIETRKRMACKLIPVEQFKPADVEFQVQFQHENIAELYGAILSENMVHLYMEAGEGGSVLEKLESCGPLREFEIIWVTKHILKGLDFLHSKNVIHHDIKPSNIVFMSTKAVLVDFGLSIQMSGDLYYPKDLRGTEVISSGWWLRTHGLFTDIGWGTVIILKDGKAYYAKKEGMLGASDCSMSRVSSFPFCVQSGVYMHYDTQQLVNDKIYQRRDLQIEDMP